MGDMADMIIGDIVDPILDEAYDLEEESYYPPRSSWPKKLKKGMVGMRQAQNVIEEQVAWRKKHEAV